MAAVRRISNSMLNNIKKVNYLATATRSFSVSTRCQDIFNVQDEEDFETRVIKSNTPVIVDFHAK